MKHRYEIFEKFPDGSSLWRESALSAKTALREGLEMAAQSTNEFYAIDLTSGEVLNIDWKSEGNKALAASSKGLGNEKQSSYVH
jgi:hypothetical protein